MVEWCFEHPWMTFIIILVALQAISNIFCAFAGAYETEDDEHDCWETADDGDGVVCPKCGEDFCTIIHETDRFKHCPNCGKRLKFKKG